MLLEAIGNSVGQYVALSSTNKSLAAAYVAKDFNYVFDTSSVASFLPQATTFLQNIPEDISRFQSLAKNVQDIENNNDKNDLTIQLIKNLNGLSDVDVNNLMPPELLGQLKAAQQDYAASTAILADEVTGYIQRLDSQAKVLLQAWDKTKKTEASSNVFGAITVVVDILTGLGIGGNAITQSIAKEFKEVTKGGATYDRLWNGIGLRTGQVGDMLQAAFNSGLWLSRLSGVVSIEGVYDKSKDADISTANNLKLLLERVKKYEEEEKWKQDRDPNPFVPI